MMEIRDESGDFMKNLKKNLNPDWPDVPVLYEIIISGQLGKGTHNYWEKYAYIYR